MGRRYTDEEARAVFDRALSADSDAGIGHEELVAAAAEVGLSREAVERAIGEMEVAKAERETKHAILARRRRRFVNHLVPFVAVNGFLFLINSLTSPGAWWCLFPLFAWGLGLFFHAWAALSSEVSPRALRRELARSERRQQVSLRELLRENELAQRRSPERRIETSAKLLGDAVEEGVGNLLSKLADQMTHPESPAGGLRVSDATKARVEDRDLEQPLTTKSSQNRN